MLSVLLGEQPDLMKHIADFYFPRQARILDVSHGIGSLVQRLGEVSSVDIDPRSPADIQADSRDLPLEDCSFDVAIFDPPYLYGRSTQKLHDRPKWTDERSRQETPGEFMDLAKGTALELERVLEPGGIVVVKVADSRYKGRLILNHSIVIDALYDAGLPLRDLLVYIRGGTGVFKNGKSAQNSHGYFVIAQKPTQASFQESKHD